MSSLQATMLGELITPGMVDAWGKGLQFGVNTCNWPGAGHLDIGHAMHEVKDPLHTSRGHRPPRANPPSQRPAPPGSLCRDTTSSQVLPAVSDSEMVRLARSLEPTLCTASSWSSSSRLASLELGLASATAPGLLQELPSGVPTDRNTCPGIREEGE